MGGKEKLGPLPRKTAFPFGVHHPPPAYTAQRVAEVEHVSGKTMVKVVMAFADGKMVMLAVPAPRHVSLTKAAEATGAKDVRLAHEEEFATAFPDCEVGAMPPL